MDSTLVYIIVGLGVINLALLVLVYKKSTTSDKNSSYLEDLDIFKKDLHDEFQRNRDESAKHAKDARDEAANHAKIFREENRANQDSLKTDIQRTMTVVGDKQKDELETFRKQINTLTISNDKQLREARETMEKKLTEIQNSNENNLAKLQESNEKKLEEMRKTVDEKLQSTLEKRLGESFKQVRDQLDAVHKGLGEMQNLAKGVGELKSVLTNVKSRGTWGEVQLGAILEDIMRPDQYDTNVKTKTGSQDLVEFAIKLPGDENDPNSKVWLPIDSKFPQEDYQRLSDAAKSGNKPEEESAKKSLLKVLEKSAKEISSKYIDPPNTTNFAIMFLPTEGLYAEILREPGMVEKLQKDHKITVAGPTTLSAMLNSFYMGFQTLAIAKRSSEVWDVLGAVKTEFGKFGGVLEKVKNQLNTASKTLDGTDVRKRAMERALRNVDELSSEKSSKLLSLPDENEDNSQAKIDPIDPIDPIEPNKDLNSDNNELPFE